VPISPPRQYALWWRLTERCAGRSADFNQISWYAVPDAEDLGEDDVQGEFFPLSHRIVVAGRWVEEPFLVRHEMLHAITGYRTHPAEVFQRRCAGVVVCVEACVADGGALPLPDSTGPVVRPRDLDVSARVDSTNPSLTQDSAWVALTIEVHNSRATPVRVRLTPLQFGDFASPTYGYRDGGCEPPAFNGPNFSGVVGSTIILGAGETRRRLFDFQVKVCTLVKPFFNDDTLDVIRIVPRP